MSLAKLRELKELFDHGSAKLRENYWTEELLQIYSETLGERIKWKWDSFLADLHKKSLHPETLFPNMDVIDWGCGPGTASFAFAQSFKQAEKLSLKNFRCEDRSPLAVKFAEKRLGTLLNANAPSEIFTTSKRKVMLISYVLSELGPAHENELLHRLHNCDAFLWVDSGAFTESRRLSELRNQLLSTFTFLSPCPHQFTCPLSEGRHPQDWCHRFAKTPAEVFHSAHWGEFAKVMKIDLRSLPYSSLFAVKKSILPIATREAEFLSRPRVGKHEILWDVCTPAGTYETVKITKRAEPERFKKIKKQF